MLFLLPILIVFIYLLILICADSREIKGSNENNFYILPTQLFENIELLKGYDNIYLMEDPVYFTRLPFHKLKLVYHRATMKYYYDHLKSKLENVYYVEYPDVEYTSGTMYDPVDHFISKKTKHIKKVETPAFITPIEEYDGSYKHDTSFYRWQRRRLNLWMSGDKPQGGKWTYDDENRNNFPPDITEYQYEEKQSHYLDEAKEYIEKHFPNNYGEINCVYPHTHKEAKEQLDIFIKNKIENFGQYQDAVSKDIIFGYHSVLSSSLNMGLITPKEVLEKVLVSGAPINSLEGFVRQLIGWREYCRLIYEREGEKMRKMNYFNHKNKLNENWWTGNTGLEVIDSIIHKVHKYAYAHHIERLMYLSSVMLMCQIDPNEVYKWFTGFVSIDAYDWVMVPNIYGMGTYADGGLMMSRPYFSSANYIEKMSDYSGDIFTELFHNFLYKKKDKLKKNYYTARWIKLGKKNEVAEEFIKNNIK